MENVIVFDTTLRDGEQCPGASLTAAQKLVIARQLERLRVDVIEAGFPIASPGDFQSVRLVAEAISESTVCALARARIDDIDRAAEALAPAKRKRLHVFISTSPLHMRYKLQLEPHAVLEAIDASVRHARNLVDDVEWSCEDGTRSDPEFLRRCFDAAIRAGATTVNIADTVGYVLPTEFAALVRSLRERVAGMDKVRFSVHCHDDLGLATANSLAALEAGARQFECTINGIGERAGNAPLEEIVMALRTRAGALGLATGLRTEELTATSKLVSTLTGFVVPPNKAIVGSNAFAHESGIHQHGVIAHRQTYEIMEPSSVGADGSRLVMGKHSGRHAFRRKAALLGFDLEDGPLDKAFAAFKILADERKSVTDAEIVGVIRRQTNAPLAVDELVSLRLESATEGVCRATVEILSGGMLRTATGSGATWIAAALDAVGSVIPRTRDIASVRLDNVTQGPCPEFLATVRLGDGGGSATASDNDPTLATVRAAILAVGTAQGAVAADELETLAEGKSQR